MTNAEPLHELWRQGRKVPHHVYRQIGEHPDDSDPWVGSFPDPRDAAAACAAVTVCAALGAAGLWDEVLSALRDAAEHEARPDGTP